MEYGLNDIVEMKKSILVISPQNGKLFAWVLIFELSVWVVEQVF